MGSMIRSEEMILVQMFMQSEAAYETVSELGEEGTVQFRDLNEGVTAFQRRFVSEVRRCDEMERQLRFIEGEMTKAGIPIPDVENLPRAPERDEIPAMENLIDKTHSEISQLTGNEVQLKKNYNALTELKHVLEKTEMFFEEAKGLEPFEHVSKADRDDGAGARGQLDFVAGVIRRQRIPAFERMLWRVSRGNVYVRRTDLDQAITNPYTGVKRLMTAFIAFFQGEQLKTRIIKICTGFHAKLYPCPPSHAQREKNLLGVNHQLDDLDTVLTHTTEHTHRKLREIAYDVPIWHIKAKKTKAIYHTLNLFNVDVTNKCFIGECWVPTADLPEVQQALVNMFARWLPILVRSPSADVASVYADSKLVLSVPRLDWTHNLQMSTVTSDEQHFNYHNLNSSARNQGQKEASFVPSFLTKIETTEAPPTFNRVNRFTKGFQVLIDAYGVSTYREANPALYTIITFPFLFAVMFGDLGHGFIMAMCGIWMVTSEKKLAKIKSTNEIWNILFAGRYIVMLMGLFSMYTGLVYNDFFCKSVNIFGSSWRNPYDSETLHMINPLTLDPRDAYVNTPYFIGMDPVWQLAQNKIIFLNSYKMKMSIIFGVIHMIFGVCMSVVNYNYFNHRSSIFVEFLPQIIFLMLLFLYMVFMMFFKWVAYSCTAEDEVYKQGCAPSVLILFINMMLFSSSVPEEGCEEFMFKGQNIVQRAFVAVALCCIPVMLFGKPLFILCQRKKKARRERAARQMSYSFSVGVIMRSAQEIPEKKEEAEEPFSEIMIHQGIHTIEYVLSTISHTASYLRLWALSLAHAELSEVLWTMVLRHGLKDKTYIGGIKLFFTFASWAMFTLAILVLMEGLSAFLHTLRLHWVEFMSKFFSGLGHVFQPFSFITILNCEEAEEDEEK